MLPCLHTCGQRLDNGAVLVKAALAQRRVTRVFGLTRKLERGGALEGGKWEKKKVRQEGDG